ncbi:MAG TPA: single-stranded-DNA-specific exonuclease RecJ [Candidatus Limnocylindrales bacterium]|jgi:single-stranded-DNA-specific exonuclease
MLEPRFAWHLPAPLELDPALVAEGAERGVSERLVGILAGRGIATVAELEGYLGPALAGLHDPALLPDADRLLERLTRLRTDRGSVLVFGDFDADGLTGLAIMVRALRRFGLAAEPYVPSRLDEGHGLSSRAVEAAAAGGHAVIVTVDTGSSSVVQVAEANERGIDVLITDHHRVPELRPAAYALVNPHRPEATYPDPRLAGSGVAFKIAQLLLAGLPGGPDAALGLAELAAIGTVADVAPILGENRAIARIGLDRIRTAPLTGLAALLARAGQTPGSVDLETVSFVIAPRLNAAGRVGSATEAALLLLTDDPAEAARLADALEGHNLDRRVMTRKAVQEANAAVASEPGDAAATLVKGDWPIGVIGLVAARLAEERGRPAVVGTQSDGVIRASCRSAGGVDLAAILAACDDLLTRHGGHPGAAGLELPAERWEAFRVRFLDLAGASLGPGEPARPGLNVELVLPALGLDYALIADLARLAPTGPGNADPLIVVAGLTITRVRAAAGGHTQLTLKRRLDVVDGIAFGWTELAGLVGEGDRIDVVARPVIRSFGGYESLQLEIRDAAPSGSIAGVVARLAGGTAVSSAANAAAGPGAPAAAGARSGS